MLVGYNRIWRTPMSRTGPTPEQRQLIEQAGTQPVRIEDPETRQGVLEAVRRSLARHSPLPAPEGGRVIAEDLPPIVRSQFLPPGSLDGVGKG
jgi:hypothetical protein